MESLDKLTKKSVLLLKLSQTPCPLSTCNLLLTPAVLLQLCRLYKEEDLNNSSVLLVQLLGRFALVHNLLRQITAVFHTQVKSKTERLMTFLKTGAHCERKSTR